MDSLLNFDADFVFLGNRSYVHGTTMTQELLKFINSFCNDNIERLVSYYHKPLNRQGTYYLYDDNYKENSLLKSVCASYVIHTHKQKYYVVVTERNDPVVESIFYDENEIINGLVVSPKQRSASLKYAANVSLFNIIVALNKKLINNIFQDGFGQWFMGGSDLQWNSIKEASKDAFLELKIVGVLGEKNVKTNVYLEGKKIGHVLFVREVLNTTT